MPDGSTDFDGNCSCPVGLACKHVAAELFAARRNRRRAASRPATLRKDDTYGADKGVQAQAGTARYLRPWYRVILRRTDLLRYAPEGMLGATDPPDLLRRIIITGRGRTAALNGPPLQEGPVRPGRLAWRLEADGRQRPVLELR